MSALLLPTEPDHRPSLTAVPSADASATRSRSASGPAPSGRSAPTVRRTTAAGRPRRPSALAGPERRSWDPLRFQPALADGTGQEKPPARSGVRSSPATPVAAPRRQAGTLVCAAAESLLGLRPAEQLARWTTPELFDALVRRAGLARRILGSGPRRHPVVRSVHLQATPSGACEAAVILDDGRRMRAAAARLIVRRGRWVLDRLEIA